MLAIIPIFIEGNQDFWHSEEGERLLAKCFSSASDAREIDVPVVCTNDQRIFDLSVSLGMETRMLDISYAHCKHSVLPPGAREAAANVLQQTVFASRDLIFLNFRNPGVTSCLLDEAIKTFKHSKRPALISVKESRDNPCQLSAYYKILEVGFLHILEDHFPSLKGVSGFPDPGRVDLCLTRAFYFDWEAKGIGEADGLAGYVMDNQNGRYIPVQAPQGRLSHDQYKSLWIREAPKRARVLFALTDVLPGLVGCPDDLKRVQAPEGLHSLFIQAQRPGRPASSSALEIAGSPVSPTRLSPMLLRDNRGGRHVLSFGSADPSPRPLLVRVLPVPLNDHLKMEAVEFTPGNLIDPIPIPLELKDLSGIAYSVFEVAVNESYDLSEPFPPKEELWTTQTEINGRQDFPAVYEPDGSFSIMGRSILPSLETEITQGRAHGFILKEEAAVQINSTFDMVRYAALQPGADDGYP
ncbi:MAG: hypothetical protein C4576_03575 [Desulfobacteraceae bacterium]|nr:MAG: hypothetical protein C4576_03575 [Desulfobacteraceae bacterium]